MDKTALEWLVAGLLPGIPRAAMMILNYHVIYLGYKNSKLPENERRRVASGAPLLGGVLVALGLLIGFRGKHIWLAAIPLLLDPGGISGLAYSYFCGYRDMKKAEKEKK